MGTGSGAWAALGPGQAPGGDGDFRTGHRAGGGGERERRFKVKEGECGEDPEPEQEAGWVLPPRIEWIPKVKVWVSITWSRSAGAAKVKGRSPFAQCEAWGLEK